MPRTTTAPSPRRRQFAAALLLPLLLLSLATAPAAHARSTQDVFFEAPRDLTARGTNDAGRAAALATLESLGVRAIRVNLPWADVAPGAAGAQRPAFDATDPAAYQWGNYAAAIDAAKAKGWKVLISPAAPVPRWATAAKADHVTRPSSSEFGLFATAAARRFAGPTVLWSIWNEPNLPRFLRPQKKGGKPIAGRLYRQLYAAGKRGIESVQPSATVLFGETAPVGLASDGRLRPIEFLRDAFCVSKRYKKRKACAKLPVDGIAHHPYRSIRGIPKNRDDVTYQVIGRLTRAIDRIGKAGATTRRRPVYLTEFGIQSTPDKLFGVPVQQQLEERARAERKAYANGRVKGFSQYLLTDDDATGRRSWNGFETGLRYAGGKDKRSLAAFRLVLDARPSGKRHTSLWGLVRPARAKTKVVIERRLRGRSFRSWKRVTTKANGSFTARDRRHAGVRYRYRWTAPDGTRMTSPWVRVFRDR